MSSLYRLLDTYEPLIYIGLTIWGLFVARGMYQTWREWRDSVCSLEREFALQKLIQRTVYGIFILGFIFVEFFISTFIVPTLPASDIVSTPTLDLLAASANTLSPGELTQAALLPATQAAPNGMSGCVPETIMITAPKPGEEVRGTVVLNGTASIPNFGFYKYEISSIGSNVWATDRKSV